MVEVSPRHAYMVRAGGHFLTSLLVAADLSTAALSQAVSGGFQSAAATFRNDLALGVLSHAVPLVPPVAMTGSTVAGHLTYNLVFHFCPIPQFDNRVASS